MSTVQKILIAVGVAVVVVLILILAGAIPGTQHPTEQSGRVTLWGFDEEKTWSDAINAYKESHPKVSVEYKTKNLKTFEDDLVNAIARQDSPDVIMFPSYDMAALSDILSTAPPLLITEREITQQYIDASSLFLTPKKQVLGIPAYGDALVLYFNKDLFTQNFITLPPATWNEFLDDAQKITRKDSNGNILISGAALGRAGNIKNAPYILEALLFESGEKILDENDNIILGNSVEIQSTEIRPAKSALRFFVDFANIAKNSQSWSAGLPEAKDLFVSGKLGMYLGFISEYSDIKNKNPHLNFAVSLIPKLNTSDNLITSGSLFAFAVPRASKNQFTAWSFATFFAAPENSALYTKAANAISPRRDLIASYQSDSLKSIFAKALLGLTLWRNPDPAKTDPLFRELIENVATGKLTLREALDKTAVRLQEINKKPQ